MQHPQTSTIMPCTRTPIADILTYLTFGPIIYILIVPLRVLFSHLTRRVVA